ncbi:ArsR/SmtB family transcription factor [Lactococcus nasutitermitis]|uniref:ArsR/SmtB family transcription factor n=1 Tax=Lactococcus nasutitermitis TaxID=1652957 RepID=A0ABV9JDY0_9LACT|nr:metalloregulator ArsR/SmtB family transcription factor [Lactococcus nasutitermitis]
MNNELISEFLKLLANENRLAIILSLAKQPLIVSEIVEQTKISQSLASQQLKLLKSARIVSSERHGKSVLYSLYDQHILHLLKDISEHVSEKSHD